MDLIDIIGFGGAGVVLAAFALGNLRTTGVPPKTLALMNLGAGALSINGLMHHAWPSTVTNSIWFLIALVTLVRMPARPAPAAAESVLGGGPSGVTHGSSGGATTVATFALRDDDVLRVVGRRDAGVEDADPHSRNPRSGGAGRVGDESVAVSATCSSAKSRAASRSGKRSAAEIRPSVIRKNVATRVSSASGLRATWSTTITRSPIRWKATGRSVMPDCSIQPTNASTVIGPAPRGPFTTIGSVTAARASVRSHRLTARCQRTTAASSWVALTGSVSGNEVAVVLPGWWRARAPRPGAHRSGPDRATTGTSTRRSRTPDPAT